MPPRSASIPLACSMITRLSRAVCSCVDELAQRVGGAVLDDADRRDVRESLSGEQVGLGHGARLIAEEVERADHRVPDPHRSGVDRAVAAVVGVGAERRPPPSRAVQIEAGDGLALSEGVEAGALVVLELEQLQQLGALVGGRHRVQRALPVGHHDPGGVDGQQLDTGDAQVVQQVDHVVVGDEGVGEADEDLPEPLLAWLAHDGIVTGALGRSPGHRVREHHRQGTWSARVRASCVA